MSQTSRKPTRSWFSRRFYESKPGPKLLIPSLVLARNPTVDLGVGAHYAATQVQAEETDSDLHGAGDTDDTRADAGPSRIMRAPAGLSFGKTLPSQTITPMHAEQLLAPPQRQVPQSDFSAALPDAMKKGIQEVALIAGDLGYFPKTVFVARDVPVRLYVTGASKNTLCLMMDSFQIKKQVRSQKIEEVTFTPTVPGKYRYYCPVNGMEGTMIVKELTSGPSLHGGEQTAALISNQNHE